MVQIGSVIVLAVALLTSTGSGQGHSEGLSGLTFVGFVTTGGVEEAIPDTIVFAGCQFSSSHFGESGFPKACYGMKEETGSVRFDVESVSKEAGSVRWKGTVRGEEMEAMAIVMTPAGKSVEYQFRGRKFVVKGS